MNLQPIRDDHPGYKATSATVQDQRSLMSKLFLRSTSKGGATSTKRLFLSAVPGTRSGKSIQYFNQAELLQTWKALRPMLDHIEGSWQAMYNNEESRLPAIREKLFQMMTEQVERLKLGLLPDLPSAPQPAMVKTSSHTKVMPVDYDDDDTETDEDDFSLAEDDEESPSDMDSDGEYRPRRPSLRRSGRAVRPTHRTAALASHVRSPRRNRSPEVPAMSVPVPLLAPALAPPAAVPVSVPAPVAAPAPVPVCAPFAPVPATLLPAGWGVPQASLPSTELFAVGAMDEEDELQGLDLCMTEPMPEESELVEAMRQTSPLPSAALWCDPMGTTAVARSSQPLAMACPNSATPFQQASNPWPVPPTIGQAFGFGG